ncbi:MAG TPA: Gfo/Idh/MocA family oxidoreductase [Frankiaceae bacterium]|jgi:predicted dehydrogenase|nr:Gfo/Idh/MocA family oxidoreductase [Frankiaceae bacterium]
MSQVRVALLGYGVAGEQFHAPLIHATPGMQLAAIVTANTERAARAQARYPGTVVHPRPYEIFGAATDYDLVVIATPNATHVSLATSALDARLAVVVDKPLATSAPEAQRIVEHARAAGLLLTVFQNRRWDSDFLTLQRLISNGDLGNVWRFESRFERWRPQPKQGWRESGDPSDGGGILADLGSHLVDQALVLFGPVTRVYATMDKRRPGVAVEDDACIELTHASGVRSTLWVSAVAAHLGPRLRVLGSRAAYVVDGLDCQEDALRAGADPAYPDWGKESPKRWGRVVVGEESHAVARGPGRYPEFYGKVRDALRLAGPLPVKPEDAVATLRVLDAARRSADRGEVVRP